jgi:hypothetical protein
MSAELNGYKPGTERMELPDGQWWEIIIEPTRGMRKLFRTAGLAVGGDALKLADAEDVLNDDDARQQFLLKHATELKLDSLDDAFLVHGTSKWSFDMAVTVENIDALPDKFTAPVLARMNECYQVDSDEEKKD